MTGEAPVLGVGPLAAAMRLLDEAKDLGFTFERIALGPDAPLHGVRNGIKHVDEVYVAGFGRDCTAIRRKRYSMIVPGGLPVSERIDGDAVTVLLAVTGWRD
ncbi:MAG TPA: hypothetical protein VFN75_11560 [Pseudonocardiaceae bacterium]|nr:hypothetical protein [Pseudonocardiaceae bacterium]